MRKRKKSTPTTKLKTMSNNRINTMSILDSKKFIRFLYDYKTDNYVVFNGRFNATFYCKSYQMAERYFKHLVQTT